MVDKSSTDATPEIAAHHADGVITVPWTPTVEHQSLCRGSVFRRLDLVSGRRRVPGPARAPASVNWPHPGDISPATAGVHLRRASRRRLLSARTSCAPVSPGRDHVHRHGAWRLGASSDRTMHLPPESGVVIHHLSHRDMAEWIGSGTATPPTRIGGGQSISGRTSARSLMRGSTIGWRGRRIKRRAVSQRRRAAACGL